MHENVNDEQQTGGRINPALWNVLIALVAAGLLLVCHWWLVEVASFVCRQTAPPNISPDSGQPWMDRHYVPAYEDNSMLYALGILLAGNVATAVGIYFFSRRTQFYILVVLAWLLAMMGECLALLFMHPW